VVSPITAASAPLDSTSVIPDHGRVTADLSAELDFAIAAARAAGTRVLALRASGRWSGDTLADVADHAADGFLQGLVRGRLPDDGVLSEETADTAERLDRRRVWIIDPLDGTREYSQMRSDWAVHVALVIDGRPALGAVALPAQAKLVWGVCAEGGGRSGAEGDATLVRGDGASPDPTSGALRIAVSRSHTPSWMPRVAEELGAELVPCGSVGAKVALLLLGQADVYAHRRGLKEWDTCAPECVARALGWSVGRLDGSEQRYNRPDPRVEELVVCRARDRARVHAALRAAGV
jgi:3'(2'), 5'-bisphosphate nucleotidase